MTTGQSVTGKPLVELAAGFDAGTRDDWRRLMDRAIGGVDFKTLLSRTADGLTLEPIYARGDGHAATEQPAPSLAPFTRGTHSAVRGFGWQAHQRVGAADPQAANRTIIEELEGGANGIVLEIEAPGQAGSRIRDAADMATALAGMHLDLAAVQFKAGLGGAAAARAFLAAIPKLRMNRNLVTGFLNLDPIGSLARWGTAGAPVEEAIAEAMALAIEARAAAPRLRTVSVDATIYHEAGGSEGQELAALAATLVAYLRTFEAAGVVPAEAMAHIGFELAADTDQFLTIAKVRAARRIIWRVAEASGAGEAAAKLHLTAVTSARMMAKRDPWTNLLRTTLACAGAGLGGADAVTVLPFTSALGEPDGFARRIARNIQIVLQEESALGRVLDPTGGSWYIENLTAELAANAWSLFQDIEAKGGIISALGSGDLQREIAAMAEARGKAIATGRQELTGVSAFPLLGDDGVKVAARRPAPALKGKEIVAPLTPHRTAEPFEELRDKADAHAKISGKPYQVFLASIGAVIDHTQRSTWVKNYLAAGGIAALTSDGYKHAVEAAAAFRKSGAKAACICSSDALNAEHAEATAKGLKAAGAKLVLMAGRPGAREAALRAAGVDQFLVAGADAVATLKGLQETLGD